MMDPANPRVLSSEFAYSGRPKLSLRRKRTTQLASCTSQPSQVPPPTESLPSPPPPSATQMETNFSLVLSRCTQSSTHTQVPVLEGNEITSSQVSQSGAASIEVRSSKFTRGCEGEKVSVSREGALQMTNYCEEECTAADKVHAFACGENQRSPTHDESETILTTSDAHGRTSGTEDGLGGLFFCQICQKDLTHLNVTRRTQHVNRCCELEEVEEKGGESTTDRELVEGVASRTCLLCKREFKTKQAMLNHMKGCAKKKGLSTAQLLNLRRKETEADAGGQTCASADSQAATNADSDCRGGKKAVTTRSDASRDVSREEDFKLPPPPAKGTRVKRGRKRKGGGQVGYLGELEDEQLRLALALSASINPQREGGGEEGGTGTRERRRKRSKKGEGGEIPPPLLLTSSSQAKSMVAQRAEQILASSQQGGGNANDDGDISCTPAFGASELAGTTSTTTTLQHCVSSPPHTLDAVDELLSIAADKPLPRDDSDAKSDCMSADDKEVASTAPVDVSDPKVQDLEESDVEVEPSAVRQGSNAQQPRESMEEPEGTHHCQQVASPLPTTGNTPPSVAENPAVLWSQLVLPTSTSGCLGYATLWQMSSLREGEEEGETENFYVPALAAVISPVKKDPALCRICGSDPCLAVSTCKPEGVTDSSRTTRDHGFKESASCTVHSAKPPCTAGTEDVQQTSGLGRLVADYRSLVSSQLFSDVLITTRNGSEIPAHALILTARCPALGEVLQESTDRPFRLDFSDFDEEAVLGFLEYLYCAQSPLLLEEGVRESLLLLAHRWSLEEGWLNPERGKAVAGSCREEEQESNEGNKEDVEEENDKMEEEGKVQMASTVQVALPTDGVTQAPTVDGKSESAAVTTQTPSPSFPVGLLKKTNPDVSIALQSPIKLCIAGSRQDSGSETTELDPQGEATAACTDTSSMEVHTPMETINNSSKLPQSEIERIDTTVLEEGEREDANASITDGPGEDGSSVTLPERLVLTFDGSGCEEETDTTELTHEKQRPPLVSPQLGEPMEVTMIIDSSSERCNSSPESVSNEVVTIRTSSSSNEIQYLSSPSLSTETTGKSSPSELLPPSCTGPGGYYEPTTDVLMDWSHAGFHDMDEGDNQANVEASVSVQFVEDTPSADQRQPPKPMSIHFATPTPISVSTSSSYGQIVPPSHFSTPGPSAPITESSAMADTLDSGRLCATTPSCSRIDLESDDNITPLPDYRSMRTPLLKGECSRFGVCALPKRKMIAKLEEIYNYTHPLVDEGGIIVLPPLPTLCDPKATTSKVPTGTSSGRTASGHDSATGATTGSPEKQRPPPKGKSKAGRQKQQTEEGSSQKMGSEGVDILERVKEVMVSDTELHQDILLYKPLELAFIQEKLKLAGVSIGKEKLSDILDHLCVTFSQPRPRGGAPAHKDPPRT